LQFQSSVRTGWSLLPMSAGSLLTRWPMWR